MQTMWKIQTKIISSPESTAMLWAILQVLKLLAAAMALVHVEQERRQVELLETLLRVDNSEEAGNGVEYDLTAGSGEGREKHQPEDTAQKQQPGMTHLRLKGP